MKNYMAIDQHGQTFHDLGQYPRKELLNRLDRKHADKMYVDGKKDGKSYTTGYVIAGLWLSLYRVEPMGRSQ